MGKNAVDLINSCEVKMFHTGHQIISLDKERQIGSEH